tara:strand:- start:2909 stop:3850 length:942 start_codon:yes stop_codon:yes gene_type:complete
VNILYVDSGGTVSDGYMYQYYGDLFREIKELASVYLYEGPVENLTHLVKSSEIEFEAIIFGLGFFANTAKTSFSKIPDLDTLAAKKVCMLHKPQTLLEEKLNFCKLNNVDILLDYFDNSKSNVAKKNIKSWFTAKPEIYKPRDKVKVQYDIGFSGALHGKGKITGPTRDLRPRIGEFLEKNKKYKTFWNSGNTLKYRINSVEEYAKKINECKIWLATTGPVEDISPRYFEVALSKTLLFCNDMPKQNGNIFLDGQTCVTFNNDLSDFEEKLDFYLNNDAARNRIIKNAYDLVSNKYTWKHLAENLLFHIKQKE